MASAVIGSLRVVLGIDTAIFDKGLGDAMKSLKGVGKSMQKVGKSMSTYLSAPIAAFGALTIKTAGDFEASMNRVEAATGASADQFKSMRDLAVKLGADTIFSASESADAMEMLAKNGLKASQILDGAVSASMQLAAASGSDLSAAADVATDVMMNFGKSAKELGGLVDGITGVLLESKFGFDDYRLAIGQAGGVAGNIGVSFKDFNAVIASTSSAFASGSDAGTSFKNFLTRLVPISKEAAGAMEELGLKFFKADGSMKSMSEVAEELRTKMSGLSDEDLNEKMKTIFGVDAMRTAIMLMKQGGKGIDAMKAKLGEASAEEQAAARLKGFNGELEKLSGAFESLQIAIASSGLLSTVSDLVSKIAEWVDKLAETNPQILKWGTVVGGLAVVLGPVVLAVGALVAGIAAIGVPVAATVAGIAALVAGLVAFAPQINAAQAAIEEWVSAGWNALKNAVDSVQTALENLATAGVQAVANLVNGVQSWIEGKLDVAAPVDSAGNPRQPVPQDFQRLFAEYEALLMALGADELDIEFPYGFINATNAGDGTANAIIATTDRAIPDADGGALIALPIVADNTGAATVSFNGGAVLTIKTSSGSNVSAAGLKAGMIVAGYVSGSTFRLLTDQASAAIVAAAEAAADRAEAAAGSVALPSPAIASTYLRRNAGNTEYEALTGEELVTALNVKALNAADGFSFNTTALPNQPYLLSEVQGSNTRTVHDFASTQTAANNGPKTTVAITRKVTGGGAEGPGFRDSALAVVAAKDDLNSTVDGEVDALFVNVFSNARSDAAAYIGGGYKKVGDGTASEGALTTMELSCRRFTTDIGTFKHFHQTIIGFSPNPTSTWGGREPIGFYSENHIGDGFANFLGISDGAEVGAASMTYLLAGFRSRDIGRRYFSVAANTGHIESRSNAFGASGGEWRRTRDKATGATNDIIWNDYYSGRNDAGEDVDYIRLYAVAENASDGGEDGSLRIVPILNGAASQQMRIGAGVAVGPAAAPPGSGTLNVQTAIALNGTVRIDANGGYRFPPFTGSNIGTATHAVNTSQKVAGKAIWDSTNHRILVATGPAATDAWNLPDGTLAVTPA